MTRLLIWRHGRTAWNAEGRKQGQTDIELDSVGSAQAAAAAAVLAAERPDTIVSSDLRRALDTAAALSALTGVPVQTDVRLREECFGPWEGLVDAEIAERWPAEYERFKHGLPYRVEGVESRADAGKRAAEAMLAAVDATPDGTVVVATHGSVARYAVGLVLDWPDEIVSTLHSLDNCHWTELRRRPHGWSLYAHNVGFVSASLAA
jgi:probable phosphoglycerate mutase